MIYHARSPGEAKTSPNSSLKLLKTGMTLSDKPEASVDFQDFATGLDPDPALSVMDNVKYQTWLLSGTFLHEVSGRGRLSAWP